MVEVWAGKFAMILFGGVVVGFRGVRFAGKGAEVYFLAVELNSDFPLSLNFVPFEALVFGAGFCLCLGAVADVLRDSGGTEIGLSIIAAVTVYVVADHSTRHADDLVVHPNFLSVLAVSGTVPPSGVRAGRASG